MWEDNGGDGLDLRQHHPGKRIPSPKKKQGTWNVLKGKQALIKNGEKVQEIIRRGGSKRPSLRVRCACMLLRVGKHVRKSDVVQQ